MANTNRPSEVRRRAMEEHSRNLVDLGTRIVQRQGYSRHLTLPKEGAKNLGIEKGTEIEIALDMECGELILRPVDEEGE